jgi:SET domain-containing protein
MNVKSYLSPKTRIKKSAIGGYGLFAVKPFKKNELVGVKGGHIIDWKTYKKYQKIVGDSYFQIDDNLIISPLTKDEAKESMMCLNHSCEPNVGVRGEISFMTMRNVRAGEELTIDYAMIEDNRTYKLKCDCGSQSCRGIITGKDWRNKKLQTRYKSYFARFIQDKIDEIPWIKK